MYVFKMIGRKVKYLRCIDGPISWGIASLTYQLLSIFQFGSMSFLTCCRDTALRSVMNWPQNMPQQDSLQCPADQFPVGFAARSSCPSLSDFRVHIPELS